MPSWEASCPRSRRTLATCGARCRRTRRSRARCWRPPTNCRSSPNFSTRKSRNASVSSESWHAGLPDEEPYLWTPRPTQRARIGEHRTFAGRTRAIDGREQMVAVKVLLVEDLPKLRGVLSDLLATVGDFELV